MSWLTFAGIWWWELIFKATVFHLFGWLFLRNMGYSLLQIISDIYAPRWFKSKQYTKNSLSWITTDSEMPDISISSKPFVVLSNMFWKLLWIMTDQNSLTLKSNEKPAQTCSNGLICLSQFHIWLLRQLTLNYCWCQFSGEMHPVLSEPAVGSCRE